MVTANDNHLTERFQNIFKFLGVDCTLDVCIPSSGCIQGSCQYDKRLKAPGVHAELLDGKFTIDKVGKPFSSIGINQAQE